MIFHEGVSVNVPHSMSEDKAGLERVILEVLSKVGVRPRNITHDSNVSAFVGFKHATEVSVCRARVGNL